MGMFENLMSYIMMWNIQALMNNILYDPARDDGSLYHFSNKRNLRLITPIKQYPHTIPDRIDL